MDEQRGASIDPLAARRGPRVRSGFKFKIGFGVEDQVTGYKGVITARAEYADGTRQYRVEAGINGTPVEHWFDEARLSEPGPLEAPAECEADQQSGDHPSDTPPVP